jgi:hypothetical protein
MAREAERLARHCQAIQGSGASINMMGIDFGSLVGMLAQSNLLLRKAIEANANAGLGIGFEIDELAEQCRAIT